MNRSGKYLLDTNIVIGMFTGDKLIQEKMKNSYRMFLSSPVIGELYYGAKKSSRPTENLAKVNSITQRLPIYSCDLETARQYGDIKDQLSRKGRLIPDNDIWIAAVAMQHGLVLVTRDAHFNEVESLEIERW